MLFVKRVQGHELRLVLTRSPLALKRLGELKGTMGIFYQDNPRKFDKKTLVLISYTHVVAFKRTPDTIMISVDSDSEIYDTFHAMMKYLKRRNAVIVWYLPDSKTPSSETGTHAKAAD